MLRDNHTDPNVPQQWEPPTVAYALTTATAASSSMLGDSNRHVNDLMGASGGSADRVIAMDIYQELASSIPNGQNAPPQAAEQEEDKNAAREWTPPPASNPSSSNASASNPFGSERHQLHEPPAEPAGAELKPQQAIPPELALKAAVAASQSALDAMTRARDALSADIIDQQQRHQQLQLLLAAASR